MVLENSRERETPWGRRIRPEKAKENRVGGDHACRERSTFWWWTTSRQFGTAWPRLNNEKKRRNIARGLDLQMALDW
jgi:hypothetical protein